jgi:hypothetical protein
MNNRKMFFVLCGLVLAQLPCLYAMLLRWPPISEELSRCKEKMLRQQAIADAFVVSKRDELLATSVDIPPAIAQGLAIFFGDEQVKRLFVDRYKTCIVSSPVKGCMQRDGGMRLRLLTQHEDDYKRTCGKVLISPIEYPVLLAAVSERYCLVNLDPDGDCFVLTSTLWPGYVVKIAAHRWIDNDAMLAFPYQLISRVFYNMEINNFIAANGYDQYILRLPKSLYHIPGTPDVIHDDNYVVVEPLLYCPPVEENERKFCAMSVHERSSGDDASAAQEIISESGKRFGVKEEYYDVVNALVRVIRHSGLWFISTSNVFCLDDGRIAILDTERSPLVGSEWRFFFHQGEGAAAEIACDATRGLMGLVEDVLRTDFVE